MLFYWICFAIILASVVRGDSSNYQEMSDDLDQMMRGMREIERDDQKVVYAKYEKTSAGSIETKLIVPNLESGVPANMQQLGQSMYDEGSWQQQDQQSLPQVVGPEEEVLLPDRQFGE